MKPGHELSVRSEFTIGDRIVHQEGFFGTVIGIRVAFLDDPDKETKMRYAIRWNMEYPIRGWTSWVGQKELRSDM